jgi:hypothetical protein
MALNINQFAQTPVKGQLDLSVGVKQVLSCQVDTSSAGSLVNGQAVKLVDVKGGIPNVVECAADSDNVFGFIVYDIKDKAFNAGDKVEIAFARGSVMYMEASAAIVPYAKVAIVISGQKVVTASTGKMIVGYAIDKAAASGELIRVMIDLPGAISA